MFSMTVIGSDGLRLWIGDGTTNEAFLPLKGCRLTRWDISQRGAVSTAVHDHAWQIDGGLISQILTLEGTLYATDDSATLRLRNVALQGIIAHFRLALRSNETVSFSARVTQYEEQMEPGSIKQLRFRLTASDAITVA